MAPNKKAVVPSNEAFPKVLLEISDIIPPLLIDVRVVSSSSLMFLCNPSVLET
jgi:hypothetical protein